MPDTEVEWAEIQAQIHADQESLFDQGYLLGIAPTEEELSYV